MKFSEASPAASGGEEFQLTIRAGKTETQYWRDLWQYRELFFFLSWRDILVRYKQTTIGILWALIRPVLIIMIGTVIFGRMGGVSPGDILSKPVLICAAVLPWQFFSTALSEASNSLIMNANMLSKIYFPRIIIPASAVIVSFGDLLISLPILIALMAWHHVMPTWRFCTLPLFLALGLFAALGVGFGLSALNVKYRDFRYVIPFVVQFGIFASPVFYTSGWFHEKHGEIIYQLYRLNPMVGVIDGFRWAIGGQSVVTDWNSVLISVLVTGLIMVLGLRYFRATEQFFADII
jgi:lipopolysaccharide transport system permease protein